MHRKSRHSSFLKKTANVILFFAVIIIVSRFLVLPQIFPQKYQTLVEQYAQQYEVDTSLVYAVMYVESKFDATAVSPKAAKGLMQISDGTGEWAAKEIGLENFTAASLFQPEINIQIGCWYLNKLTVQFAEPLETALAAYNAGSGNVSKWLSDSSYSDDGSRLKKIPYGETDRYVKKVLLIQKIYEFLY